MDKPIIRLVTTEHPFETLQARIDFSEVAGKDIYERPWWYEHTETGRLFYDIVACLGWPEEVKEGNINILPGYAAIVGIVRPHNAIEAGYDATNAKFYILEELNELDVPTLLSKCVEMRKRYGFGTGVNKDFLSVFYGDPERFTTALALRNEYLTHQDGEYAALVVAPPDDFCLKNRFEVYVRTIKSVIQHDNLRLFFGKDNVILKNSLKQFKKDDPAVLAMGGLVHTLLNRTLWMGKIERDGAFFLKEVI